MDRLAASKADAYVALESNVIARWELEGIETGQQAVGVRIVFPVSEDAGIRGTAVLIRDQIFVLYIVLHGLGNARAGEASINGCLRKIGISIDSNKTKKYKILTGWLHIHLQLEIIADLGRIDLLTLVGDDAHLADGRRSCVGNCSGSR